MAVATQGTASNADATHIELAETLSIFLSPARAADADLSAQ